MHAAIDLEQLISSNMGYNTSNWKDQG